MFLSPRRFLTLLGRIRDRPARVVSWKAIQYSALFLHHQLGLWRRYERAAEGRWNDACVARFVTARRSDAGLLISTEGLTAVRDLLEKETELAKSLRCYRDRILDGRIPVFESCVEVPSWDALDWSEDWRFGHRWPPAFYRQYNFYERSKPAPYDVKFPWELSRLNFVMIPTLLAALDREHGDPEDEWTCELESVLRSWRCENPVAHSVNWYPMECAMRAINLAQLVSLLVHVDSDRSAVLRHALVLCELHGRFLYRTIEYGEVRGNHFAAEIVALLLLGLLLRDEIPEAARWSDYARRFIESEVLQQFTADGVQFEKSTGYHCLVTQLFLLAFIALEKSGIKVATPAKERLLRACEYTQSYLRPDGKTPVWGDSDDARATWFDVRSHRDHRFLTALASVYFRNESLRPAGTCPVDVPLFLASSWNENEARTPPRPTSRRSIRHFAEGGMVCATVEDSHFVADVGGVGMNGRGGHGHLDALSFELTLGGVPLVVDPGSYLYTGSFEARNRFRSTSSHNVAVIDGEEMATLFPKHLWRLGTEADPFDVDLRVLEGSFELSARHDGYTRLDEPVPYERHWRFLDASRALTVIDRVQTEGSHHVARYLHLSPHVDAQLREDRLDIYGPNNEQFQVVWQPMSDAELVDDWVSESYGQRLPSRTLVLNDRIGSSTTLELTIREVTTGVDGLPGRH